MPPVVHILILAAGASSRMRGSDKLTTPIEGTPLLRRIVAAALATGAPVTVTLPADASDRRHILDDLAVTLVTVPDAALGMSRSLTAGIAAITEAAPDRDAGLMILPADMPDFTTPALQHLMAEYLLAPDTILRGASEDGRPGHPAIFPRDLWSELAAVTGDEGGRSVLQRYAGRVRVIPLPGDMATLDLDTPEDWAAYLRRPASSA